MYYKVVNSNLTSAYTGSKWACDPSLIIRYKIGEWVKPKITGTDLMVFSDLESAKNFMLKMGWGSEIFSCEVKKPSKRGLFIVDAIFDRIIECAQLRVKHKKFRNKISIPKIEGTVFCKAVKLLEKIY